MLVLQNGQGYFGDSSRNGGNKKEIKLRSYNNNMSSTVNNFDQTYLSTSIIVVCNTYLK